MTVVARVQLASGFNPPGIWSKYSEFKTTYQKFAEYVFDYMSIGGYQVTVGHFEFKNTLFIFGLMNGDKKENATGMALHYKKGDSCFTLSTWIDGEMEDSMRIKLSTDPKSYSRSNRIESFLDRIAKHIVFETDFIRLKDKTKINKIAGELARTITY